MKYNQYFKEASRLGGGTFVHLTDDAPQNLRSLVHSIHEHFVCGPNEWIYNQIHQAFCLAEEGNNLNECTIDTDPYHWDLQRWLNNPYAVQICNDILEEENVPKEFYLLVAKAQWHAIRDIYDAVQCMIDTKL